MKRRPEFTLIAGPNGAGKSQLCPFYIHVPSFDGDKLLLTLQKEHPDWPERWLTGSVAGELDKQKQLALDNKTDFAFETNFSNDMAVQMLHDFKYAGFKTTLCYFGLYSEADSVSRVMFRAQKGGHDVAEDVIRFNFNEGLKNTRRNLHIFDNLTFVDGGSDYGHIVAIHISQGGIHEVEDNPPLWFKEQFDEAFANIHNH